MPISAIQRSTLEGMAAGNWRQLLELADVLQHVLRDLTLLQKKFTNAAGRCSLSCEQNFSSSSCLAMVPPRVTVTTVRRAFGEPRARAAFV